MTDVLILVALGAVALAVPATFLADAFGIPLAFANTIRLARLARRHARARTDAP